MSGFQDQITVLQVCHHPTGDWCHCGTGGEKLLKVEPMVVGDIPGNEVEAMMMRTPNLCTHQCVHVNGMIFHSTIVFQWNGSGDVAQMVERTLSMREAQGSIPWFSTLFCFF